MLYKKAFIWVGLIIGILATGYFVVFHDRSLNITWFEPGYLIDLGFLYVIYRQHRVIVKTTENQSLVNIELTSLIRSIRSTLSNHQETNLALSEAMKNVYRRFKD